MRALCPGTTYWHYPLLRASSLSCVFELQLFEQLHFAFFRLLWLSPLLTCLANCQFSSELSRVLLLPA